jgi:hypothetical protein
VASGAQAVHDDDEVLAKIQKRLASSEKLKYHSLIVFVAEIRDQPAWPGLSGSLQRSRRSEVELIISRLLWGDHPEFTI